MINKQLDRALELARQGIPVVPLVNGSPPDGLTAEAATTDARMLRNFWEAWPNARAGTPKQKVLWNPWAEPCAPSFPLNVLPPALQLFVVNKHAETGACQSAIAMAVLGASSAGVTHEARLYLKPNKNFGVSPRLWVMLVGNPSARKTPAIDAAVRPLRAHQQSVHKTLIAFSEAEREAHATDKNGRPSDGPHLPQFVISDTTPEKLAEILGQQDRGTLLHADELAGWLGALDRYGTGKGAAAAKAMWLQAFDGGYFNLLRIGRQTVPVNNLSVSILGGIQPERLRELGNLQSDGLLQRFLPVMMSKPQMDSDTFDASWYTDYANTIADLASMAPVHVEMSPGAYRERERVSRMLFDLGQVESEGTGWQGFVGKLNGVWGNIALLLHCLWEKISSPTLPQETAELATELLTSFILPHGLIFYRSLAGTGQTDLRSIAGFVASWDSDTLQVRDLGRGPRCCRGLPPEEIVKKVAPLEAGGWLTPVERGPWNRSWKVTPGLAVHFRREVERHRAAIAAIQEQIAGVKDD